VHKHTQRAVAQKDLAIFMTEDDHQYLLAQVASMYYEQEKSQNEIGVELGLSRVKVYRLLKEAREENVVRIIINWPIERVSQLEEQFAKAFHLKKALILKSSQSESRTALQQMGQMAARYLQSILKNGMTLSVCVGGSTYEVIHAIEIRSDIHVNVVQAMGSTPFTVHFMDSSALARELAQKLGGEVIYLPAPFLANNQEEAVILRKQESIARTLIAARRSDILLVGIGAFNNPARSRFVESGIIPIEELQAISDNGAVGDIGGRIFTLTGSCHSNSFNDRMIGLTLEEMKQIPYSIAAAIGKNKAEAILGGLRTGVIDVLCTDSDTAQEVLKLNESAPVLLEPIQ